MSNLADVRRKKVSIVLSDGVERELKFTLNSMAEIEDKYGSAEEIFEQLEEKKSFKALRCLLWAGMIHQSPDITEIEVGNLIDMANIDSLMVQVAGALNGDLPPVEKKGPVVVHGTVIESPNA